MATSLGHKIRMAREDALMSQAELASKMGVSQSLVSQYELGRVDITVEALSRLARVLNKPITYFFSEEDSIVPSQADFLLKQLQQAILSTKHAIPILGKVPAGDWEDASLPDAVDTISLDETLGKQASFGLWVEGQSMHPTIQSGDLVLVQQGRLPRNRDVVVVRNEHGEATLKRYINLNGKVYLKPDNPDYGEPTSEVGIIVGVVIGVVRYLVGRAR